MLCVKDPGTARHVPMLRHNGHCEYDPSREDYWIPAMGDVDFPEVEGVAHSASSQTSVAPRHHAHWMR